MRTTGIIAFILLILALGVAIVAAFFSISGLAKLFSAAVIPVIIMAGILEAGKIGGTFYLHHYWKELPNLSIKWPLSLMVAILMVVTSMGIFGFLAKGHIEQENPAIEYKTEIEIIDQQIEAHNATIQTFRTQLDQINDALNVYIERDRITTGFLKVKEQYREEIDLLNKGIAGERDDITKLRAQRSDWQRKINKVEAELGPIRYVAELFNFDLEKGDAKGKAVRLVILMLMAAFDPLAIVLIMAFDWTLIKYQNERKRIDNDNKIMQMQKERASQEAHESPVEKKESITDDSKGLEDLLSNLENEELIDYLVEHPDALTEIEKLKEETVEEEVKEKIDDFINVVKERITISKIGWLVGINKNGRT